MSRVLPKTLTGQLVALVLLTLFLSQVLAFLFFWEERREAIREIFHDQVVVRTLSLVRLLQTEDPNRHAAILRAASTGNLRFSLSRRPEKALEERGWRVRRFERRLKRILGKQAEEVHLVFMRRVPEGLSFPMLPGGRDHFEDDDDHHEREAWYGDDDDDWWENRSWRRGGVFLLSVKLSSKRAPEGRWLTALGRMPPLPPWNWQSLMAALIAAATLVVLVILVLRRITRPMARLAEEADAFGRGGGNPLPEEGPQEARRMIRAFNQMRERIDRFLEDRMQMLAAISHDLRTPITSLRLRAEFIEDEELRTKVLATLEEMQRMTEETLSFLREEATREEARLVDIAALSESLVNDRVDLGENVSMEPSPALAIFCRPTALRRAINNLVSNALRYGGSAKLKVLQKANEAVILVEDDGPGIPEEKLARVFEPFVRLEDSRSSETGGLGLGLAIARTILRSQGGDITLSNLTDGGLQARISLPSKAGS
ncbi:MAG: ATP-binding protein [Kiloniellales bacterium]|nr:ATP-binding protein [Kiloniellales bacterium]